MNQLIISLAFPGRENYPELQEGLIASIEKNWDGDAWINPNVPYTPHSEVPYKFKYDLIETALQKGYRKIWWMDSTMRLKKNPSKLLDDAFKGIAAFDNIGHPVWKYISDQAKWNLNVSEKELSKIPQTWGGCQGWNFNNDHAEWIFRKMKEQIRLGSFQESVSARKGFVAHRHDQAVLSVLLYQHMVDLLPYGVIAAPKDANENTYVLYGDGPKTN